MSFLRVFTDATDKSFPFITPKFVTPEIALFGVAKTVCLAYVTHLIGFQPKSIKHYFLLSGGIAILVAVSLRKRRKPVI